MVTPTKQDMPRIIRLPLISCKETDWKGLVRQTKPARPGEVSAIGCTAANGLVRLSHLRLIFDCHYSNALVHVAEALKGR